MSDNKIEMNLETIMGDRFSKYSKYIIQERALPDVRDGLKPVQRRILYAMFKEGNTFNKPYRKSAKTVGNVIGNYHPHGDTSVYDAMVRLSQEWKMRIPLVDMQGNNGSIDNDPAAAMRYTEARLAPIANELLTNLDKDTVLMSLNFDDTEYEPTVLPAGYPNLIVNGATGISAGYATDIPPHNFEEVIDATVYKIKHPEATLSRLMNYIKGPDFPTGAIVEGREGIVKALKTGRGKVIVRSKTEIVESKNMNQIVVTEIPYEVNKADMVRKIDEIRFNKDIDGIIEVRDESDRKGLRVVIDLKKTVDINNTLNYFYKNTDLQKNYNYNMVAIKDKRPVQMGVVEMIEGYIAHEVDVTTRAANYDLNQATGRKHIIDGLIKAISILDEVVATIRKSKDKGDAKNNLVNKYDFTEKQAEAIVMLQLYRLTNTDIVSLEDENKELSEKIAYLNEILNNPEKLNQVIIDRLVSLKKKYPMPRLTEIKDEITDTSVNEKAMIIEEDINVSITKDGYVKRISNRSLKASENTPFGKKDDDLLLSLYQCSTLDHLLLFTNKGNYLYIPTYKLEEFKWKDAGKHISYLTKMDPSEKIIETILVKDFNKDLYVMIASKNGQIKRTALKDFEVSRYTKEYKCMGLKKDDEVVGVKLTDDNLGVILTTRAGYATMYSEKEVSIIGVKASGIKSIRLNNDHVVSLSTFDPMVNSSLIVVTEVGSVKRVKIEDIPACNRTNKGTLLYKNPKSKAIYVYKSLIAENSDEITILTSLKNSKTFKTTEFSFGSDTQKPTPYIKIGADERIINVSKDNHISTDDFKNIKENKNTKIFEEKREEEVTLLDELEPVKEVEVVESKKETKPKKKKEEFEKITLEDILNEDDF
ncbi:MAG: DNA topoisomerase IV subunit A [Thomasclavelia sp.]|nr:DNA topoisomerase IV subunit A [Thomasclavelia sp.]